MKKFTTALSLMTLVSVSGLALTPLALAHNHKGDKKACSCKEGACKECGEGKCECKDNCECEGKCDCAAGSTKDKKADKKSK